MITLGHYQQPGPSTHDWEVLFGDPGALPFQWAHCDLTANALAAYFSAFCPADGGNHHLVGRDELAFSVNYVANELLENAHKFGTGGAVRMRALVAGPDLLLWVSNTAAPEACRNLERVVGDILKGDAQQLLLERIEQNALNPGNTTSGLGYLTMMSDYGVRFGWAFREHAESAMLVETQAWLSLQRKSVP